MLQVSPAAIPTAQHSAIMMKVNDDFASIQIINNNADLTYNFIMSQSSYWKRQETPFNSKSVSEVLKSFRSSDLGDPQRSRRWIQFAKQFSQMALNPSDIEQMPFESFYALRQIMASTLNHLSESTIRQSEQINNLDRQQRNLKKNLQKLKHIQQQNKKKFQKLNGELVRLQQKQKAMSLQLNQQSEILHDNP